jgi:hypothetical protein
MKTKKYNSLFILFGILLGSIIILSTDYAFGAKTHPDITLYTTLTDKDVTIAWDDTNTELLDFFDFYMWNYGEEQKYIIGKTQQLQVTIMIPKTGLYIFYIRACDKIETDDTRNCSEYVNSNLVGSVTKIPYGKVEDPANPGTYINGKWMIYGHVAPPTGGGVDTTP